MSVTKEDLLKRLKELQEQESIGQQRLTELSINLNAIRGAITITQEYLASFAEKKESNEIKSEEKK